VRKRQSNVKVTCNEKARKRENKGAWRKNEEKARHLNDNVIDFRTTFQLNKKKCNKLWRT